MAWCTRAMNFKFGYSENPYFLRQSVEQIEKLADECGETGELAEIRQGALAGAVARTYGVNLLPPESYRPIPLVRGSKLPYEITSKKEADALMYYMNTSDYLKKYPDYPFWMEEVSELVARLGAGP